MMFGVKQSFVNLEGATGFSLKLYDSAGIELDSVGMFSTGNDARTREELILLSAAKTLAYMHRFCFGNGAERKAFMPHLRDFRRKLDDFICCTNGRRTT